MPVAESELEIPLDSVADTGLNLDDESLPSSASKPSKPIVGIIYPPPEVRNIVDKTASFVARNGPEFESRIKHNEQNNPKFNFLNSGDPYHGYYQHKVKEIQEGKSSQQLSQSASTPSELLLQIKPPQQLLDEAKKKKQSELLKQVELPFVPKDPPSDFEFFADPPSISAHDLDVVKLTAQFVARNGRQFLSSLMTREQRNYQFDFLRPQHSLFQYFTKLLEQYTKVLIPPKDIVKKLSNEDKKRIVDDVKYRANWIKHQEAQRRKEEEEAERERMAYACIDWHDFVVVETVDYQPFESGHFPPPTTPQEVGARVLLQDRILQGQNDKQQPLEEPFSAQDDTEVQDMEEDSDSSEDEEVEQPKTIGERPPMIGVPSSLEPPREDRVIIKKGYDPKQAKVPVKEILRPVGPEEYTISPITGERIPVSKLQEHVRIGLLDPRWRDQRDRQLIDKVNQESVYAPGFAIDESLKQLAERRSDIFGVGVEETPIGKKVGEEERLPGMPWDPTPGISLTTTTISNSTTTEEKQTDSKKDTIGPNIENSVIASGPQPPQPPSAQQPPQPPPPTSNPAPPGILQPPPPTSSMPPMSGIVRPVQGLPMSIPPPPGAQPPPPPGVMLMQGMPGLGQMRPLLAMPQPGFSPFNPAPPGTLQSRPPLLAPAPPVVPPISAIIPQQPPSSTSGSVQQDSEEPPSKKAKNLEDSLIPEGQFFASNPSPVKFNVLMPSVPEKPEMNLQGQMIKVNLNLMETISVLKAKICESIGLAPGKQKLRLVEGLFFKDSNSLAFYNVGDGATIHLSLKERGGRKK